MANTAYYQLDNNLFKQALHCLQIRNPEEKTQQVKLLQQRWLSSELNTEKFEPVQTIKVPGRPDKPLLVHPRQVPRRNFTTEQGRMSLVHAIAHIEFNAINLALDAVYRFQNMPSQYYSDWCQVAAEEAEHFLLLSHYLQEHGVIYGDFNAHNGLWEMACKTDFDVLVRMALVPRVLEARGLDVTPGMIRKLQAQHLQNKKASVTQDDDLIAILQRIFEDEIGHVKIGSHWFNVLCEQRNINPEQTFSQLLDSYMKDASFGPFDLDARQQAGFSEQEMNDLVARIKNPGLR